MRFQALSFGPGSGDPCQICGGGIKLSEVEPHPNCDDWELNGYSCENCGPVKSLVVQRPVDDMPPLLKLMTAFLNARTRRMRPRLTRRRGGTLRTRRVTAAGGRPDAPN
jgi:hypothetical protein